MTRSPLATCTARTTPGHGSDAATRDLLASAGGQAGNLDQLGGAEGAVHRHHVARRRDREAPAHAVDLDVESIGGGVMHDGAAGDAAHLHREAPVRLGDVVHRHGVVGDPELDPLRTPAVVAPPEGNAGGQCAAGAPAQLVAVQGGDDGVDAIDRAVAGGVPVRRRRGGAR